MLALTHTYLSLDRLYAWLFKLLFRPKRKICTKEFLFWIILSCVAPHVSFCQAYPYKFHYLTVDEGLSHTDANDIAQDKNGYIWVATYFGLDRFDGYSVKKYYNNNVPVKNAFKNRITCIYPDENGNIWLGTEDGLQCFITDSEKYIDFKEPERGANPRFSRLFKSAGNILYGLNGTLIKSYLIKGTRLEEQQVNIPSDIRFSDMAPDNNGVLYLTSNKGLWTLDEKGTFKNVVLTGLVEQDLSGLYFDKKANLLVSSANKVFLIKSINNTLSVARKFPGATKNGIKNIVENDKADYWLNDGEALIRLDSNLNLIQIINSKTSQGSLNSNSITRVFIDRSECLWVGTFGGGVNYCDLNEKLFYSLQHNPEVPNTLSGNHIRSVLEDGEDLWIGTTANGLNLFNLKTQTFNYYNTYNSAVKLKSDAITSLTFDNDHNLWIGSAGGIEILKKNRKELWRPPGYENFPSYVIETIVRDCYGNIWFGNHVNQYGVIWKDAAGNYHVKYYDEGYFILADNKKPQLYISSTHGLKRVVIDQKGNIVSSFTYMASSSSNSLSSNYAYPISRQNDSVYWIGTMGGGINRLSIKNNTYTIKAYAGNYGVFNDVESVEIDNDGNIWMGGNGLEELNPVTGKLLQYDKNDGLQGNSFKVGSSCKGADGRLYFGGINGLNYFYPRQIKANEIPAQPVLTDILINNEKQHYGNGDSSQNSIPQAIGYARNLTLSYLQNNFVIFFSAMHYANPVKCKYRYKLIGFDKDWKFTDGSNPSAAYSNLDFNTYKFVVEATNNDGAWSKSAAETAIIINPPWWKSNGLKTIYVLLILAVLTGIYIYQARWFRLKKGTGGTGRK